MIDHKTGQIKNRINLAPFNEFKKEKELPKVINHVPELS